jgi:hypothetical protein
MRKFVATVAVLVALAGIAAHQAWASCPPGTMYQCHQGYNGKVICGCQ